MKHRSAFTRNSTTTLFFPLKRHVSGYAVGGHGVSRWLSAMACSYSYQMCFLRNSLAPGPVWGDTCPELQPPCSPGKAEGVPAARVSISRSRCCAGVTADVVSLTLWHPVLLAHGILQDGAAPCCPPKGSASHGHCTGKCKKAAMTPIRYFPEWWWKCASSLSTQQ